MRKPRDFDAELKALGDRARQLKERKVQQLGELVIAAGADGLSVEQLAGLLLSGAETRDTAIREGWRKRGAAFFQGATPNAARVVRRNARGAPANDGGAQPAASPDRTA